MKEKIEIYEQPSRYGYSQNGRIIIIPPKITRYYDYSRRLCQTLADIQHRDIYLYSINSLFEIYKVRKIRCMQNRKKGGLK